MSHLQYADDTMICPNDHGILENWWMVLDIFLKASELSLNLDKTSLIGIHVAEDILQNMASRLGCKVEKLPVSYLGIPLGEILRRILFGSAHRQSEEKN